MSGSICVVCGLPTFQHLNPVSAGNGRWMHKDCARGCPKCGSTETTFGYGLAGGGIGAYRVCLNEACGELFDKTQDDGGTR